MYIKKIILKNFRNYEFQEIDLNENINIFYGDNAQGKTNILEAIYMSSIGKSFRTNKDIELIKENEKLAEIEVLFFKNGRDEKINAKIDNKKLFLINDIPAKKTSEILGKINTVLFSPEDIEILRNEPLRRRKFLNIMISSLRPQYIHFLSEYNKVLEQRNKYLKQIKFENKKEENLDIWDEQLVKLGLKIYKYRKDYIKKINDKICKIHLETTNNKENIKIKYKSNINKENYYKKLIESRKIDLQKGFTNIGIHRDDFEIFINEKVFLFMDHKVKQDQALYH